MKFRLAFFYPIIFFVTVFAFFYPFFFQKRLPIPADTIVALYSPYKDFFINEYPRGVPFKNFLITDPVRQQYPWRELVISSEKKLQLPLWNPYNGAGEPLLGNIQSAALYPLNVLFLLLPFATSWSLLIFLQPLLAGFFLYLYLRNLRLSQIASLLGGVVFAFSGFSIAWLEWGTIGHVALWLPLILLSIDKKFYQYKNHHAKFKIQNYLWNFLFLFSLSAAFFAGHIQTFFYVFFLSFFYFLARWFQFGISKKIALLFFILVFCFLLLSAVQWLPTLQLINFSARDIDQSHWQQIEGWFIPWQHLIQFIAPDFFGNPTTLNYWGTWNYGELIGYVGIAPLILSLFALIFRRDKKTLFFGTIFFLSLIFSLPTIFAKLPYLLHIPFLSTSQPTRLLFLTDFSLSILAAFGCDMLLRDKKKLEILYPIFFIGFLLGMLWIFVLWSYKFFPTITFEQITVSKRNLFIPTTLFIITSFMLLSRRFLPVLLVGCVILFITISDLHRFGGKFTPFTNKAFLFPQTKTVTFLSEASQQYPWRFLGVDYVVDQKRIFAPNLSSHNKLYTVDTYNPLLLKRYQEFAAISEWGFVDIPNFSFNRSIILNNYESQLIDFLGVKYIVTLNDTYAKKLKFLFKEGETRVYENTAVFPRAFIVDSVLVIKDKKKIAKKMYARTTNLKNVAIIEESLPIALIHKQNASQKVTIDGYSENIVVMTVTTSNDGFLVLTDTFYPTWHAFIDGKETKIYRTNYNFRGIVVPNGKHTVVFENNFL